MKSRLVARRQQKKTATVLMSTESIQDAVGQAHELVDEMVHKGNDSQLEQLEEAASFLEGILAKSPTQMQQDGVSTADDYCDDAIAPQFSRKIKQYVDTIAQMHNSIMKHDGLEPLMASGSDNWEINNKVTEGKKAAKNCTICGKPITLFPSAAERAKEFGGRPSDYTDTFTTHSQCQFDKRNRETSELIERNKGKKAAAPGVVPPVAPQAQAPVQPAAHTPVPAAGDITAEQVIAVIPTEMILKIVNDLPKRDDFEQSNDLKDALIYMTEVLKTRPVEPEAPVAEEAPKVASWLGGLKLADTAGSGGAWTVDERKGLDIQEGSIPEVGEAHSEQDDQTGITRPSVESVEKFATAAGGWSMTDKKEGLELIEGKIPEVGEAHSKQDDNTGITKPATESMGKFAADMTANKAVKLSEKVGESLKALFLEAKALCETNDTRPVREAVDSIYKVYQLMGEATKVLNKQLMQEEAEKTAVEVKEKGKKSSSLLYGLKLADFDGMDLDEDHDGDFHESVITPDAEFDIEEEDNPNIPHCDQCQMTNINGVNCHETGCPNQKKTWVPNRGWVKYNKCGDCGFDVEEGEGCNCQEPFDLEDENPWG